MKRWLHTVWQMCWKCEGAGIVMGKNNAVPIVCFKCEGTGLRKRYRR